LCCFFYSGVPVASNFWKKYFPEKWNRNGGFGTLDVQAKCRELKKDFMPSIAEWMPPTSAFKFYEPLPFIPPSHKKIPAATGVQAPQQPASVGKGKIDQNFVDKIAETFAKISDGINKELDVINEAQKQRQIAMADLFAIRDALTDYLDKQPDPSAAVDLSTIKITLRPDSPLSAAGINNVKDAIEYYHTQHSELSLPGVPEIAGGVKSYLDSLDKSLQMVLEPASQNAFTEIDRLTQKARAMEQLQSSLYQIYFEALKRFTSGS
jgi:hypothetical protein